MGSLGAGNHFLEIQKVDEIYDPDAAKYENLFRRQLSMNLYVQHDKKLLDG